MQINISKIDQDQFNLDQQSVCGQPVFLITPKRIGVQWTQQNKIFRSSVWDLNGDLVSAGFYKFPNWSENPDNFPVPKDLSKTHIVEKCDGSCLIISFYQNQYIIRTRGTVSAYLMENAYEIDILKEKYPKLFNFVDYLADVKDGSAAKVSLLAEWLSPSNQIVIKHSEPSLKLIGAVKHDDYSLYTQKELDKLSKILDVPRPGYSIFSEYKSLIEEINKFDNFEGVCVYSNGDQDIHKVKTENYLKIHAFKNHASIESVLDLFIANGCPDYNTFCEKISDQFDFECLEFVRGHVSNICDAHKDVLTIIDGFAKFIARNGDKSRKDFALETISSYGNTNRAGFIFTLKDKGQLDKDSIKKLMWQVLKK